MTLAPELLVAGPSLVAYGLYLWTMLGRCPNGTVWASSLAVAAVVAYTNIRATGSFLVAAPYLVSATGGFLVVLCLIWHRLWYKPCGMEWLSTGAAVLAVGCTLLSPYAATYCSASQVECMGVLASTALALVISGPVCVRITRDSHVEPPLPWILWTATYTGATLAYVGDVPWYVVCAYAAFALQAGYVAALATLPYASRFARRVFTSPVRSTDGAARLRLLACTV